MVEARAERTHMVVAVAVKHDSAFALAGEARSASRAFGGVSTMSSGGLNLPERSDGALQLVKRLRASLAAVHVARDNRAVALRCNWRGGRAVRGGVRV